MSMTQSILITPGADAGIFTGGGGQPMRGPPGLTYWVGKLKWIYSVQKKKETPENPYNLENSRKPE